ncbi:MAG: DUF1798 family protein [Bacillus sp. (in: firmicutes)]
METKNDDIKAATEQLIIVLADLNNLFQHTKETKKEYDFYKDIEPYVNEVQWKLKRWQNAMEKELMERQITYFGKRQLEQIVDNISNLTVQAFQHTASLKRFKDYYQSTHFLLTSIYRKL